ncbi:MAG TPA: TorF family putative porin [Caulobacteraceae bacterium]
MTTRVFAASAAALLAASLATGLATGACAEASAETPKLSVTAGAATDYIWRGISQTGNKPFVFGTAGISAGNVYAGVGAENVNFGNSINMEYDLYGGWKPKLGAATLDLGFVRYGYANQPPGTPIDTFEWKAGASVPVGKAAVGGMVMYTANYFGSHSHATYVQLNANAPVAGWTVSGAVARQQVSAGGDYSTWNLGASHPIGPLTFDLRYHDTDVHGRGKVYHAHLVATLKATF